MPEYNADQAAVRQTNDWSCSCASTAWGLQALGFPVTYPEIEARMLAAGLVTPALGLLDGSGATLAAWLGAEFGLAYERQSIAQADWVAARAGQGPVLIGGHALYHWMAVRRAAAGGLELANPAPTWHGVGDFLDPAEWATWGQWAAIWLPADPVGTGDDMTDESRAYVQQVAADEIKANIEKALALKLPKAAREALEFGALPASTTLAEGRF